MRRCLALLAIPAGALVCRAALAQNYNLAAWSADPNWGCNSVRFVQVPGEGSGWTNLFLGRVEQVPNPATDCPSSGAYWSLAMGTMDWSSYTIQFGNYILQPPFTTSDGYQIASAYDPSVVYYNGEYWVAWECYGPGLYGQGVGSCMGPLDLSSGQIDVSRTYIAVLGISFDNDGFSYSASVPKLLTFQGNVYLYWDLVQIDPTTGSWNWATTRGTQLEQEPGGLRRLWPQGVGGSLAANAPVTASKLQMQYDGNLVLYDSNNTAVWATSWMQQNSVGAMAGQLTQGMNCPNCYAAFQWDGNLVLYNPDFGAGSAGAYWASNTCCNPGARYEIFQDGISIVDSSGSTLWSSASGAGGTGPYAINSAGMTPSTNYLLQAGQTIESNAQEVWGLGSDDRSNTLVDTSQFISDGQNVYSIAQLGGSGGDPGSGGPPGDTTYYCMNPGDTSPGCYRMAVAQADAPIGDDIFNQDIFPDGVFPSNPMNYPVLIFPPDGSVRFMGEFFSAPPGDQDLQTIPAGLWTFPIPCQAASFFTSYGSAGCGEAPTASTSTYSIAASQNDTLQAGQSMQVGDLTIVMQKDGNLVIYNSSGVPVWATSWMMDLSENAMATQLTQGMSCSGCYARFQGDGNLVLYNPAFGSGSAGAYWATGTNGNSGAQLKILQTSPYIEIIDDSGAVLWSGSS